MTQANKTVTDWIAGLHHFFARLHGVNVHGRQQTSSDVPALISAYAEYAEAVARASAALRTYGQGSKEFRDADTVSMRLFHRVKKVQGLKMPGRRA